MVSRVPRIGSLRTLWLERYDKRCSLLAIERNGTVELIDERSYEL